MQSNPHKKGFTLIEVIVSLVLVSIIFLTLIQVLRLTSSIHQNSKRRENATNIAMSIYDVFYGDPQKIYSNLTFVYNEGSVKIIQTGYRIYFDGDWQSITTLDTTEKFYVDVVMSEEDLKSTITPNLHLIEITCIIQVFDVNEIEKALYVYEPATSVVIREVTP